MTEGGLRPQGLIADALNVAVLETGVGVWAFDGLVGAPRIEQVDGRLVLADENGRLGLLFGEVERAVPGRETRRVALVAIAVPGVADLSLEANLGKPQIRIAVDREQLARYGLNADDVLTVVRTGIGNEPVSTLIEGVRRFDITARIDDSSKSRPIISRTAASQAGTPAFPVVSSVPSISQKRTVMSAESRAAVARNCLTPFLRARRRHATAHREMPRRETGRRADGRRALHRSSRTPAVP